MRVCFAYKYDPVTNTADVPIYKIGRWYWIIAYRLVMWWMNVGYDAEAWLNRRLKETEE